MDSATSWMKFLESLIQDYRNLIYETKRKFVPIKDKAENQVKSVKEIINNENDMGKRIFNDSFIMAEPFIDGLKTNNIKIINICLTSIQKFISHKVLNSLFCQTLIDNLWELIEQNLEELKVLQTILLVITSSDVIKENNLAKAFTICLRLNLSKAKSTSNTSAAATRQCACSIFDRALKAHMAGLTKEAEISDVSLVDNKTYLRDAYLLFEDICLLLNGEPPVWLIGIQEMSKLLALEVIDHVIINYNKLFFERADFKKLLQDRVCPIVIRLFSVTFKFKNLSSPINSSPANLLGQNIYSSNENFIGSYSFPVCVRVLHLVYSTITNYFLILKTECEIFLSTLLKLVDVEQIPWQRAIALEVIYKISIQPKVLKMICLHYDIKEENRNVFEHLVSVLSSYLKNNLLNVSQSPTFTKDSIQIPTSTNYGPNGLPAFIYRGSIFPIYLNPKTSLYENMDAIDPPTPPDGYCISLGYLSLVEIVSSIKTIAEISTGSTELKKTSDEEITDLDLCKNMINLTWCPLLAVLSLLLDASACTEATDSILHSISTLIVLAGALSLGTVREAFVTLLCKSSLPHNFTMVNSSTAASNAGVKSLGGQSSAASPEESYERSPIALVIQKNAQASLPQNAPVQPTSQQKTGVIQKTSIVYTGSMSGNGNLIITNKHLQVAYVILECSLNHGEKLGEDWQIFLTTIKEITWIYNLRITPMSDLLLDNIDKIKGHQTVDSRPLIERVNTHKNAAISISTSQTASEVPILTNMVSKIFRLAKKWDDKTLDSIISGLCELMRNSDDLISYKKEPSYFALAKLLEVGLSTIDRLNLWWEQVMGQLLIMTNSQNVLTRELASESTTLLIQQAMSNDSLDMPFWKNKAMIDKVLRPLCEMNDIKHQEVRTIQLKCLEYTLHRFGEKVSSAWPQFIQIISAVKYAPSVNNDNLIKKAFICFKLILNDYLDSVDEPCYSSCLETVSAFGTQNLDQNISLTAIESLLHILEYLVKEKIENKLIKESYEKLAMQIFDILGHLCLDDRPAIRKSAGQTLFTSISVNAVHFDVSMWQRILSDIIFPLLINVRQAYLATSAIDETMTMDSIKTISSISAQSQNSDGEQKIMLHHSRDTLAKQWSETVVLTMSGTVRLFLKNREMLNEINDFYSNIWITMLSHVEANAVQRTFDGFSAVEISVNALTSFQILVSFEENLSNKSNVPFMESVWRPVWNTWINIAVKATQFMDSDSKEKCPLLPSEPFITLLMDLFIQLFPKMKKIILNETNFKSLSVIFQRSLLIPYLINGNDKNISTILRQSAQSKMVNSSTMDEAIFNSLSIIEKHIAGERQDSKVLMEDFMSLLLSISNFNIDMPTTPSCFRYNFITPGLKTHPKIPVKLVKFAERCLLMACDFYQSILARSSDTNTGVELVRFLDKVSKLKYSCSQQSTWILASKCILDLLKVCSENHQDVNVLIWKEFGVTIHNFLFNKQPIPANLTVEEFSQHEALDIKIISVLKEYFLMSNEKMKNFPDSFINDIVQILCQGSTQLSKRQFDCRNSEETVEMNGPFNIEMDLANIRGSQFKENFTRVCFETVLNFALNASNGSNNKKSNEASRIAVRSIITKCKEILENFIRSAQLNGKCPLPRNRILEIQFVFRATSSMIKEIINHKQNDDEIVILVISLYQNFVDCLLISSTFPFIAQPLHHILSSYSHFFISSNVRK